MWTGTATCYGLGRNGDRIPVGARFSALMPALGPTQPPLQVVPSLFPGGKVAVDHPPPYSAEVKERVDLYLYSPSGHSWPVIG